MTPGKDIIEALRSELRQPVLRRFKVRGIGLFGSFSRGEQSDISDIDFLVDFEDEADLLDFVALAEFLEKRLERKVDLVTSRALREEIRDQVLKEVVML